MAAPADSGSPASDRLTPYAEVKACGADFFRSQILSHARYCCANGNVRHELLITLQSTYAGDMYMGRLVQLGNSPFSNNGKQVLVETAVSLSSLLVKLLKRTSAEVEAHKQGGAGAPCRCRFC
ncbi:hypothetical protein SCUCBS95973_002560 [Sporothrix curviconia]|uniref:Uncharacterized protein n=1 Tax=Sporothrix curviconia TaxID=1260050 RepID=A0ABP0B7Z0_9PEZI